MVLLFWVFFLTVNDFKRTNLYCVQSCSRDARQHISYSKTRRKREKKNQTQNQHSEPQCAESAKQQTLSKVISQTYAVRVSPYESVHMSQSICVSKSRQTQFFQVTYEQVTKDNWVSNVTRSVQQAIGHASSAHSSYPLTHID